MSLDVFDDFGGEQRFATEPGDVQEIELRRAAGQQILDPSNRPGLHPIALKIFVAVATSKVALLRWHQDQMQQVAAQISLDRQARALQAVRRIRAIWVHISRAHPAVEGRAHATRERKLEVWKARRFPP